ncbi:hypothetical protein BGX28_004389 [Mortierella sp. GBA30]|nr:hypothetical protein BGX28_004389 [Mortierella sp. GBA30]
MKTNRDDHLYTNLLELTLHDLDCLGDREDQPDQPKLGQDFFHPPKMMILNELLKAPWDSYYLEPLHIPLGRPGDVWRPGVALTELVNEDQYPQLASDISNLYCKIEVHSKARFSARFPCHLGYTMPLL